MSEWPIANVLISLPHSPSLSTLLCSGPEILRNSDVLNASLYHMGHAIESVKLRFDLDEISDADLPEVGRAIRTGAVCRDYNLLSGFVVTNLAALFDTTPAIIGRSCDLWTRGRLRKFLKLEKKPKEDGRRSLDDGEEKTAGEEWIIEEETG